MLRFTVDRENIQLLKLITEAIVWNPNGHLLFAHGKVAYKREVISFIYGKDKYFL